MSRRESVKTEERASVAVTDTRAGVAGEEVDNSTNDTDDDCAETATNLLKGINASCDTAFRTAGSVLSVTRCATGIASWLWRGTAGPLSHTRVIVGTIDDRRGPDSVPTPVARILIFHPLGNFFTAGVGEGFQGCSN